jgi:hypothetical protein
MSATLLSGDNGAATPGSPERLVRDPIPLRKRRASSPAVLLSIAAHYATMVTPASIPAPMTPSLGPSVWTDTEEEVAFAASIWSEAEEALAEWDAKEALFFTRPISVEGEENRCPVDVGQLNLANRVTQTDLHIVELPREILLKIMIVSVVFQSLCWTLSHLPL